MSQRKYRQKFGGGKAIHLGSTDSVSCKKQRSLSGSKAGFFNYVNRKLSPNNFPSFQKLNFSTSSKFDFVPPSSTKRNQSPRRFIPMRNQNINQEACFQDNFQQDLKFADNLVKRTANNKGALRQKLQNSAMQKFRQVFNKNNLVSDRIALERAKIQKTNIHQIDSKKSKQLVNMLENINQRRVQKQKNSKNSYISFENRYSNRNQQIIEPKNSNNVRFQESSFSSIDEQKDFYNSIKQNKIGQSNKSVIKTIDRVTENQSNRNRLNNRTQKPICNDKQVQKQLNGKQSISLFNKAQMKVKKTQQPVFKNQGQMGVKKAQQNKIVSKFDQNKNKFQISNQEKHKKQLEISINGTIAPKIQINQIENKQDMNPRESNQLQFQQIKNVTKQQKSQNQCQNQLNSQNKKKTKNRFDATDNILDMQFPQIKPIQKVKQSPSSQEIKEVAKNISNKSKTDELSNIQQSFQRKNQSNKQKSPTSLTFKRQIDPKNRYSNECDDDDLQEIDFNPKTSFKKQQKQLKTQQSKAHDVKSKGQSVVQINNMVQPDDQKEKFEIVDQVFQITDKIDLLGEYSNKAKGFYSDGKIGVNFRICGYYLAQQFNFYRHLVRQILSGEKQANLFTIKKNKVQLVRQQDDIKELVQDLKQEEKKTQGMINKLYSLCKNQLSRQDIEKGLKIDSTENYHFQCLTYLKNQFKQIYPVFMKNNANVSVARRCCYIIQLYCLLMQLHGKPVKQFEQADQIKNITTHISNNKKFLGV